MSPEEEQWKRLLQHADNTIYEFGGRNYLTAKNPLGAGGFGITYRAYRVIKTPGKIPQIDPRPLVIKMGYPSSTGSAMFRQEHKIARAILNMNGNNCDPHILCYTGSGQVASTDPFYPILIDKINLGLKTLKKKKTIVGSNYPINIFITDYIKGTDMAVWLSTMTEETLPVDREIITQYILQIGSVILKLHQNNIYHRDIKPENIMVKNVNTKNIIFTLIDFGVSCLKGSCNDVSGTRFYMPRKMLDRSQWNTIVQDDFRQMDLFAYGIIIYEMLTFREPFNEDKTVYNEIKYLNYISEYYPIVEIVNYVITNYHLPTEQVIGKVFDILSKNNL